MIMKINGNTDVITDKKNDGVLSNSYSLTSPTALISVLNWNASGAYFWANFVNKGPATTAVITDTIKPRINVKPMLAPNDIATAVGAGCGGKNPCADDKAAVIEIPK